LTAQESALHARPIIQATSADFDIREDSGCFPVTQSPAADWQSRQQLFFADETYIFAYAISVVRTVF
jgi:DsbC/DsbD-like thiol-disulfide interchange protein